MWASGCPTHCRGSDGEQRRTRLGGFQGSARAEGKTGVKESEGRAKKQDGSAQTKPRSLGGL